MHSPAPLLARTHTRTHSQTTYTPLHAAAYHGHKSCVAHLLCQENSLWNLPDQHGTTPAGIARQRGHEGIAEALERWGKGQRFVAIETMGYVNSVTPLPPPPRGHTYRHHIVSFLSSVQPLQVRARAVSGGGSTEMHANPFAAAASMHATSPTTSHMSFSSIDSLLPETPPADDADGSVCTADGDAVALDSSGSDLFASSSSSFRSRTSSAGSAHSLLHRALNKATGSITHMLNNTRDGRAQGGPPHGEQYQELRRHVERVESKVRAQAFKVTHLEAELRATEKQLRKARTALRRRDVEMQAATEEAADLRTQLAQATRALAKERSERQEEDIELTAKEQQCNALTTAHNELQKAASALTLAVEHSEARVVEAERVAAEEIAARAELEAGWSRWRELSRSATAYAKSWPQYSPS